MNCVPIKNVSEIKFNCYQDIIFKNNTKLTDYYSFFFFYTVDQNLKQLKRGVINPRLQTTNDTELCQINTSNFSVQNIISRINREINSD